MKTLRWFVAIIVGFIASVFAGGIVVTVCEMSDWVPFPLAAGGIASAFFFIYLSVKISGSTSNRIVKILSGAIIFTALISVAGSYMGQHSPMPGLGLLIAGWVFFTKPDFFMKKR